jgi:hypothetical protein
MPQNHPDVPSNSRATCSQCSRELLLRIELRIGLCTSCLLLHRPVTTPPTPLGAYPRGPGQPSRCPPAHAPTPMLIRSCQAWDDP